MSSSAITTQVAQLKIGSVQNQADSTSVYSAGVWSFKNSTALTSVTITDSGNVGIGTASPLGKFNAVSGANFFSTAPDSYTSAVIGPRSINDSICSFLLSYGTSGTYLTNFWKLDASSGTFSVWQNANQRMTIDASGNLLVGTTSASHDTITNGFAFVGTASISALGIGHITGSGSGTNYISFNYAGAKIGSITQSGTGNVAFNTGPSDYRLKEQVQNLSEGLSKIKALRPVSFVWKADQRQDIGFIAHEIQSVIPECASGEKDAVDADGNPSYQSIFPAPAQMIASLVAAIQELSAKNDALETRLAALEAKP